MPSRRRSALAQVDGAQEPRGAEAESAAGAGVGGVMSVITSEEITHWREWVRGATDRLLAALAQGLAAEPYPLTGEQHQDWFRLRRLVEEEEQRRRHGRGDVLETLAAIENELADVTNDYQPGLPLWTRLFALRELVQ